MDARFVEFHGAARRWTEQPYEHDDFDLVVEGKPAQQGVGEQFDAGEECVDDPEDDPLEVLLEVLVPDGFVRAVSRINCGEDEPEARVERALGEAARTKKNRQ